MSADAVLSAGSVPVPSIPSGSSGGSRTSAGDGASAAGTFPTLQSFSGWSGRPCFAAGSLCARIGGSSSCARSSSAGLIARVKRKIRVGGERADLVGLHHLADLLAPGRRSLEGPGLAAVAGPIFEALADHPGNPLVLTRIDTRDRQKRLEIAQDRMIAAISLDQLAACSALPARRGCRSPHRRPAAAP